MNYNPYFKITLHDYTNAQENCRSVPLYQIIEFKINNNRMEAYYKKKYLGYILKKDTTNFKYIWEHPEYFQALIRKKETISNNVKLHIDVQIKKTSTYQLFKTNKEFLNTLISLKTIFHENEEIYCNYGPATITKINEANNTIEVDIPGLGKKKLYDIYGIEKKS